MKKKVKSVLQVVGVGFALLVLIAGIVMCVVGVIYPIISLEHYNRVYQNPIIATATVTEYDTYDDDGDTDFRSYISYTVNGIRYKGVRYEDKDTKDKLTPIGTQVEIQVSPENPAKLISELLNDGNLLIFTLFIFSWLIATVWGLTIRGRRSKNVFGTPDQETIQKDAKRTICGRMTLPFWLVLALGYTFFVLRYPAATQDWVIVVAVVCAAAWLWCLFAAVRDMRVVIREDYELRRDVLVAKEIISGEDNDTYKLTYRSKDREWTANTSKKHYEQSKEGDVVLAVFIPKRKKPLVHYDTSGDAC